MARIPRQQVRQIPIAAIYPRVSDPNGEAKDSAGLATQETACRRYAEERGYAVSEEYIYRESHTGVELWERPKLTALRQALRDRAIDAVIVYAIDRLSRDPVHLGVILTEADHAGVAVEFVTEPLDNSPEGQLIRFVRGYAAKIEHEKIKERTQRGIRARVQRGRPLVGCKPLYGYRWVNGPDGKKERLEIDPETAPVVRRIFRDVVNGTPLRSLAVAFHEEGIPPPRGNREYW
jgi:site-specific DNA recombinase